MKLLAHFRDAAGKLDRHIKREHGETARFNWQSLYYDALMLFDVIELKEMEDMSIADIVELVGQRKRRNAQLVMATAVKRPDPAQVSQGQGEGAALKPGPKPGKRAERVAARQEWKNRTGEMALLTFVEWSEEKWGTNPNGSLKIPKSTFYDWPEN